MTSDSTGDYVSTGHLPSPETVAALVEAAHGRFRDNHDGAVSQVYPALARVPVDLFGLCVVGTNGAAHAAGDWDVPFTLMSVSKPFVFALVCDVLGPDAARAAYRRQRDRPAVQRPRRHRAKRGRAAPTRWSTPARSPTTSLAPGADARRTMGASSATGCRVSPADRFRSMTEMLAWRSKATPATGRSRNCWKATGCIAGDPAEALELYTRQCSLDVTAHDLAVMGATLADGGVNPVTESRVVGPESGKRALAVMATAGLYETSGDWLYDVGLPGKSGISGGIVAVSPGKGGLGVFAPRLDERRQQRQGATRRALPVAALGLSLFASNAEP